VAEAIGHSRGGARVEVVRSDERFRTRTNWLDSRHSFSFGAHYDPGNTHFGLLLVSPRFLVLRGGQIVARTIPARTTVTVAGTDHPVTFLRPRP